MKNGTYIQVDAGVRYWEDADVNGVEDEDGSRIPLRAGDRWCPTIRLADGLVLDWPSGTVADIHYKVCDDGVYHLLDADRKVIATQDEQYVPAFLSPGKRSYGDYIIMHIDGDGRVSGWVPPTAAELRNVWGDLCSD